MMAFCPSVGKAFAALAVGGLVASCGVAKQIPADHSHRLDFCLPQERWQEALLAMEAFGRVHKLHLHGSVSPPVFMNSGEKVVDSSLNASLSREIDSQGNDDFSIFLYTDPLHKPNAVLIARGVNKLTPFERELTGRLRAELPAVDCKTGQRAAVLSQARPSAR
jgi:hypothetical protein